MLRSREIKYLFLALGCIGALCTLACFLVEPLAGVIALAFFFILAGTVYFYLRRRNRKIQFLCDYLGRIADGQWTLDVRDHDEGELDILKSELYKVTSALSRQMELLKQEKTFLADSLADISHQLKTPLTAIRMMTDLLTDLALPPEKRTEFLKNIQTGLDRLEWLVAALLKLARLDAGGVQFRNRAIPLRSLAEQAAASLSIPVELRELALSIEGSADIYIKGDLNWLTEAVTNILKNAVEHTPAGETITIRLSGNPLYAQMKIHNPGPGIGQADLPHIFERFYRGKGAAEGSIGIGLALSQSIMKRQNGIIEVMSQLGEGSTFCLKFYKNDFAV